MSFTSDMGLFCVDKQLTPCYSCRDPLLDNVSTDHI